MEYRIPAIARSTRGIPRRTLPRTFGGWGIGWGHRPAFTVADSGVVRRTIDRRGVADGLPRRSCGIRPGRTRERRPAGPSERAGGEGDATDPGDSIPAERRASIRVPPLRFAWLSWCLHERAPDWTWPTGFGPVRSRGPVTWSGHVVRSCRPVLMAKSEASRPRDVGARRPPAGGGDARPSKMPPLGLEPRTR